MVINISIRITRTDPAKYKIVYNINITVHALFLSYSFSVRNLYISTPVTIAGSTHITSPIENNVYLPVTSLIKAAIQKYSGGLSVYSEPSN